MNRKSEPARFRLRFRASQEHLVPRSTNGDRIITAPLDQEAVRDLERVEELQQQLGISERAAEGVLCSIKHLEGWRANRLGWIDPPIPTLAMANEPPPKERSAQTDADRSGPFTGYVKRPYASGPNKDEQEKAQPYQPKGDSPVGYLTKGLRPNDILVGDGFLERGGAIMIAGPSGIGKSSQAMQIGCYWSCGEVAFDLGAHTALRVLMVQHEDSHNDLVRMSALVGASGLNADLIKENFWIETLRGKIGRDAIKVMDDLVVWHRADLLIINPLSAFHDGNISQNEDNIKFLYGELGALLDARQIGLLAFHHKGKPPKNGKKNDEDVYHEVMYETLGGSVLTNFFRGIITVSPIANSEIYKFVVAKRFEASGWLLKTQHFKWHEDRSKRLWVAATIGEADTAKAVSRKSLEDLRKLVPPTDTIAREILDNRAAEEGFVRREYRALLEEALADTTPDKLRLYKWSIFNSGGQSKVAYSRFEQPAEETAEAIRETKRQQKKKR